jgi:hypothetical protein
VDANPEPLTVDIVYPAGAVMVSESLIGVKLDPVTVNVFSAEIVLIGTFPNDNDAGVTVRAGPATRAVSRMSIFVEYGARVNEPLTMLLSRS